MLKYGIIFYISIKKNYLKGEVIDVFPDYGYKVDFVSVYDSMGAYNEPVKDNKLTVNPSALSIIKPVTVKASEYDGKYRPDTHNGVDNSAGSGKYFNDIIVDKSVTNFI